MRDYGAGVDGDAVEAARLTCLAMRETFLEARFFGMIPFPAARSRVETADVKDAFTSSGEE